MVSEGLTPTKSRIHSSFELTLPEGEGPGQRIEALSGKGFNDLASRNFTMVGAIIVFAATRSEATSKNPNLIVAAILSLPIITVLWASN